MALLFNPDDTAAVIALAAMILLTLLIIYLSAIGEC